MPVGVENDGFASLQRGGGRQKGRKVAIRDDTDHAQ